MRGNAVFGAYVVGRWDEAVEAADRFIAECATSPHYQEGLARDARAMDPPRSRRTSPARRRTGRSIWIRGDASRIPKGCLPGLAAAAVQRLILGDEVEAHGLAEEALELARAHIDMAAAANHLIFVAGQMGLRDEYLAIVAAGARGPVEGPDRRRRQGRSAQRR